MLLADTSDGTMFFHTMWGLPYVGVLYDNKIHWWDGIQHYGIEYTSSVTIPDECEMSNVFIESSHM